MKRDEPMFEGFNDYRNINHGVARVIWARSTGAHTEGWVLPGGVRTQDREHAEGVARNINAAHAFHTANNVRSTINER